MIGIYGGSFDPVHNGHLRIALDAVQYLQLDQVRFIPLATPVHKSQVHVHGKDRLAMLNAAIQGQKEFIIDDRELTRKGTSYTVDTLTSLRQDFPDIPLVFMLGTDAFAGIDRWSRPEQVLELAHLFVMQRPNETHPHHFDHAHTDNPEDLRSSLAGKIYFHEVTQLDISSSHIRHLVEKGQSPRYLTPDSVLKVINDNKLYL